jgi:hypothetical protein
MIVLGIDPGANGGLAIVAGQRLLSVTDVPTTGEKAKRRVDVSAVLSWLRSGPMPDHAFIERAQAMPKQGGSSGFLYGRAVGALEACVIGCQIPLTIIESSAWKKYHGLLHREKEDSRQRALHLFPGRAELLRKLDHNRAEALLIACYGNALLGGKYDFNPSPNPRGRVRTQNAQASLPGLDPQKPAA